MYNASVENIAQQPPNIIKPEKEKRIEKINKATPI